MLCLAKTATSGLAALTLVTAVEAGEALEARSLEDGRLYGSWMHACGEGECQAFLSMADKKTGREQVTWSFVYDGEGDRLAAIVNVPLGTAITPGLALVPSRGEAVPVSFQFCDDGGCRAVLPVDDLLMARFAAGETVEVQFVPYGRQYRTSFAVPTDGLLDATDALREAAGG